jgi:ribosomal protein L37AE/L43A
MEGRLKAEEDPMDGHAETHRTTVASRRIALPSCPNCNDLVVAPAVSEFVSQNRVRHIWSCEACGHEFSTSVRLFADAREHSLS